MHLPHPHLGSSTASPWRRERDAWTRGIAGALLFGAPLVFTMEMWWIGGSIDRWQLLAFLALGLLVNVFLALAGGGFRDDGEGARAAVSDALAANAMGVLLAAVLCVSLARVELDTSLEVGLSTLIILTIPLSLGASVATLVFTPGSDRTSGGADRGPWAVLANDVGATAAGAVFLALAIAPTAEVPMLASNIDLGHALSVVLVSLASAYAIVFASGFDPDHERFTGARAQAGGLFQRPFSETVLAYLVSLVVAGALLVCFGQIDAATPIASALVKIVVLGVPATIGGAAGRVVL